MHKNRLKWLISATLVLLLIALTGCQAVQGLDFGKALQNNADIQSSESKGTLGLELNISDPDLASPKTELSMKL
ncbi:hypothetical protein [Paenibacillus hexagrammi]|uniref:Uncharacterized protein n=1 Tax=Paenibacillus hexagrammi TaxID=2908839 RepID=A0ABY3SFV7_9BACL|nr:hypothetical protein [Paenibacillus sp. YPD9-1]UJF32913.1 hypothetical protein L0M14_25605 [Paenibacillus sp. YPD9-1]